mmetsp:Transcript_131527/g.420763  ORF Transcript_131527/g.420763 Transcript_131527/m.420763 type:complete len:106 (-) Transcript_131527:1108-1425(-)
MAAAGTACSIRGNIPRVKACHPSSRIIVDTAETNPEYFGVRELIPGEGAATAKASARAAAAPAPSAAVAAHDALLEVMSAGLNRPAEEDDDEDEDDHGGVCAITS